MSRKEAKVAKDTVAKPRSKKEVEADRMALEEAEKHKAPTTGSGQFEFANGAVYDGEWQLFDETSKKRHGYGRFIHGGDSFEGDWSGGCIHGSGRYIFASGATYEGEWRDNKFGGRGTYRWPSGATYIGAWVDNKMHGMGAFIATTGDRYQGTFHNDRFQNADGHWIAPTQQSQQLAHA